MYQPSSPILGQGGGSPDRLLTRLQAQRAARLGEVTAYLKEVYRLGALAGINADIVAAQAIHETGWFRSRWWAERLNPAGIGITGDPRQDAASRTWASGQEAARAHIVHLSLYVGGEQLPEILTPFRPLDPRWEAAVSAGYAGRCTTIGSLAGTWAADAAYADKLVALLNALFPTIGRSIPLRFDSGPIPMPAMTERLAVRKRDGVGMNRLGPRTLRGIVFHRAQSNGQRFDDAVGWLLRPDVRGLTDFFVDCRTGRMVRINKITGTAQDMAGWAQGPYRSHVASVDARAFVGRYGSRHGADIINLDLESTEVTGDYGDPISEACKRTLVQWTASRAQRLRVRHDQFPITPDGITMIFGHREFCGTDYKLCPGEVVWAFVNDELIERVRAVLRAAQAGGGRPLPTEPAPPIEPTPSPVSYAQPVVPDFVRDPEAPPVVEDGASDFIMVTDQYVAKRVTKRLQYAYPGADEVGPPIKVGEDVPVSFVVKSAADGRYYGMTWYGTRVLLDDLKRVGDAPLEAA